MRTPAGHTTPSDDAVARAPADMSGTPPAWSRFLRFALVGGSGVLVNSALLLLLVEGLGWPFLYAAFLSIEAATLSNWALNRAWTWKDRSGDGLWASLGRYHMVALGGMAIQWSILGASTTYLHVHYLVGSLLGVAVATGWNFLGSDRLAFARHDQPSSRSRRALWYATSFVVQLAIAAVMTHSWDTFVFQKSVTDFLVSGVTPYTTAMQAPGYIFSGASLPLTAQWYAYPPLPLLLMSATYWPVAFGAVTAPWAARILLKLPFLLGTLGFAWAARRLIATAPGADAAVAARQADTAERWLLLNPLFLVIAGVWGQFEALLLMFLTLSFLAIRSKRWLLGGMSYGAALLLKIFPVYVGPILLVHLVRKHGWRAAIPYFFASGLVFLAVTLPFYLAEPHGTIQQVFLMHAQRPPARFAPIAALYVLFGWFAPSSVGLDMLANVFGRLSFAVTAIILGSLALAYARRPTTERNLLYFVALSMTGGLLATKVFNEQYTLLPLGLLALVRYHPEPPSGRPWPNVQGLLVSGTWAMMGAALLDSLHILNYLPTDVAARVLHTTAPVAIRHIASSLGLPVDYFLYGLGFLTRVALILPFSQAILLLAKPVRDGLVIAEHALERLPALARGALSGRALVAAGTLAALIALPLSAAFADSGAPDGAALTAELPEHAALVEMRTDWYNPANDPAIASGTWHGVTSDPSDGYYNTNARKVSSDVALVRAAGADGLLVRVNLDYPLGAMSMRSVAEGDNVPYGLMVQVRDLLPLGPVGFEDSNARVLHAAMGGGGTGWWTGRWHLQAHHHPVIVLSGVSDVHPAFTTGEHKFVLSSFATRHDLAGDATITAAAATPPLSQDDLAADTATAALWRAAYAEAPAAWWHTVIDGAPSDAVFVSDVPVPGLPAERWLGHGDVDQPAALDGSQPGALRWATLQGPLTPDSLRPAWLKALWAEPTAVIVPWNDFAHERAIEPTHGSGDALLRETALWIDSFHHPERAQPTSSSSSSSAGPAGLPLPPFGENGQVLAAN